MQNANRVAASEGHSVTAATRFVDRSEDSVVDENADNLELEIQTRVELLCDLVDKLPKKTVRDILDDVGVSLSPNDEAGNRRTKFCLIADALQHMHEMMQTGDDLVELDKAIRSKVRALVDSGLIADPWDDGEEEEISKDDLVRELVSYLEEFSTDDLRLVLAGISCSCFLKLKGLSLSTDELAFAFGMHLQHQLDEGSDLAVEASVMRRVYNKCSKDSDSGRDYGDASSTTYESSDDSPDFSDADTDILSLEPVESPLPAQPQLFNRVDNMMRTMRELPRSMIVDILGDERMMWTFADPESSATKDEMIDATLDFLRNEITLNGGAAGNSIQETEEVIQDHVDRHLRYLATRPVEPRGRARSNSKRLRQLQLS